MHLSLTLTGLSIQGSLIRKAKLHSMSNLEPRNWNVWSYSLTGSENFPQNMENMEVFWNISQILQRFDVVSWTTLGDVNIHTNPKRCGIFRTIFDMCLSFGCYNDKILAVFCSLVFGWGHVCLLNGREVALLIEASLWTKEPYGPCISCDGSWRISRPSWKMLSGSRCTPRCLKKVLPPNKKPQE